MHITQELSIVVNSNHVSSLISSCAQSLHALRTLGQGMNCELQQTVYRAVIISKLL